MAFYETDNGSLQWQLHPMKRVEETIVECNGNKTVIAKRLKMTRHGVQKLIRRHPHLRELCDDLWQGRGDDVEDATFNHAMNPELPGSAGLKQFILRTQYSDRGWAESLDIGVAPILIQKLVAEFREAGVDPEAALEDLLVKVSARVLAIKDVDDDN